MDHFFPIGPADDVTLERALGALLSVTTGKSGYKDERSVFLFVDFKTFYRNI